jgi:fatty-acyl-CoA synthase
MQSPFSRTAFDLLREQAVRAPDHPAVIQGGNTVSYAALADAAARVAGKLRADGMRRGDRVGLLSNNRLEWLEVYFGAAALGAVLAPFSTWSTAAELEFLLDDAQVGTVFALSNYRGKDFAAEVEGLRATGKAASVRAVVRLDGPDYQAYRTHAPLEELNPGYGPSAGDTLVMLYTSGSSSRPKCVPLQHFAAIENGFNIGERMGVSADDRFLISIPLFWSYGAVNALLAAVSHGATLVLQGQFEPGGALDLIAEHRCTVFYTLPAMTSALLAHEAFSKERTKSLRTGVTIGAPQDVVSAANDLGMTEICNIYGQTEGYGNCCVTPHHWPLEQRARCQGLPLPGVTICIRDPETGQDCPAGTVGEILLKGYLTPGYAGNSAFANAEAFTEDGFFRSSDLGSLNEDGTLVYAGRISEMIKRSGINVSPAEVEEALQQADGVSIAGVTGVDDAVKGEIIVAFVIPDPGHEPDPQALRQHCRGLLSSYKVPDRIFLKRELPLTPTGKLMRRELRAQATAEIAKDQ